VRNVSCKKNPGLCATSATNMLDVLIRRAADRGLLVSLSHDQLQARNSIYPPSLWYNSIYSEELVIRIWDALIARYKNQWNVFAIDLKNEPSYESSKEPSTWGNSNKSSDWNKAAERMIRRIVAFKGLFFVDGLKYGSDLNNVRQYPIDSGNSSLNNRIIYTPHCYGPIIFDISVFKTVNFPEYLDSQYMQEYGFLTSKGLPVLIGEWGAAHDPGSLGEKWNKWYVEWLRNKCLTNNFYWSLDPNSEYTSGLLEKDWKTPDERKLELLNRVQPHPTKFK
ncbi:hypothetical protein PENTCL1PPCAC_4774, partial [Pristionchus entomophagus]